jgi:hypothetical protein
MDLAGVASMVGDPNPAGPMGPGLGRLTKLGQKDIAILGAAGEDIGSDVFRNPEGVSTMTRLLLQVLRGAQGSLSLDEANRQYQASFEAYLKAINAVGAAAGRPAVKYQPYYNNTCTQPVALKP